MCTSHPQFNSARNTTLICEVSNWVNHKHFENNSKAAVTVGCSCLSTHSITTEICYKTDAILMKIILADFSNSWCGWNVTDFYLLILPAGNIGQQKICYTKIGWFCCSVKTIPKKISIKMQRKSRIFLNTSLLIGIRLFWQPGTRNQLVLANHKTVYTE